MKICGTRRSCPISGRDIPTVVSPALLVVWGFSGCSHPNTEDATTVSFVQAQGAGGVGGPDVFESAMHTVMQGREPITVYLALKTSRLWSILWSYI